MNKHAIIKSQHDRFEQAVGPLPSTPNQYVESLDAAFKKGLECGARAQFCDEVAFIGRCLRETLGNAIIIYADKSWGNATELANKITDAMFDEYRTGQPRKR